MFKVKLFRWLMRVTTPLIWRGKLATNLQVTAHTMPVAGASVRLRVYTPEGDGPFPVAMYYHGGGFVLGDIDTHDALCRDLAVGSGYVVVSVDYRLAPEHPFPAAIDDALAAVGWVLEHGAGLNVDTQQLVVAGDSAGGNLAAVTALQARDRYPGVVKGQVLLYPVTAHYSHGTASYREKAKGYVLTRSLMVWFWDLYFANSSAVAKGDTSHPLATPLTVENLSGLPPAFVITAENDPLRDEGEQYAQRMQAQGVKVKHSFYPGLAHGFIGAMGPTEAHKKGIAEMAAWLQDLRST